MLLPSPSIVVPRPRRPYAPLAPPNNGAADFAARSTGAHFATNFASFADAAAVYNDPLRAYANKTPAQGATFTNAFELVTTTGHAGSGKAFRLWHGKNNYGGAGDIDNQAFGVMVNGNRNNIPGAYKTKLYVQFGVWIDAACDYYWKLGDGSPGTMKLVIMDDWDATSTAGELVVDLQWNRQFLHAYRKSAASGGSPEIDRSLSTPVNSTNYAWQNAVDRGTALSDNASYKRRYGPVYDGMSGGTSQASRLSLQGVPDPDAAIGGIAINRAGITTIEMELDLANDRARLWAAHYGNTPLLICDTELNNTLSPPSVNNSANFGSRVGSQGTGWSALTLSNLVYTATGAQNPGYPTDAYTDYSEIIFHPNPINFPGGHALPGV
jgi:hypothetical protein